MTRAVIPKAKSRPLRLIMAARIINDPPKGAAGIPARLEDAVDGEFVDCDPPKPTKEWPHADTELLWLNFLKCVREKNRDGLHEACLGGVMECRRSPAVGPLPREALVVDTCAVTQERRDILGVILSPLVSGAREPDPRPRSIDARPRARALAPAQDGGPSGPRRSTLHSLRVP